MASSQSSIRARPGARFDGRAAILVPRLSTNDAVGNDTIGLERALVELGAEVRIFASEGEARARAGSLDDARAFVRTGEPLVILQLATAWQDGIDVLESARGVRIVRDHNVTPASFFAGLSPYFVELQERAARQRAALARDSGVALFLAASAFNRTELVELGARPDSVAVVPPFTTLGDLLSAEPDQAMLERCRGHSPSVLFVGRIAPHKGHRRMLRIAATYHELFGERLSVRFVGSTDPRLSFWQELLRRDASKLGLSGHVEILSDLDLRRLKAAYLGSDLFLSCSEHEGFCIPLIEASALGLPVIAAYQEGMAQTLGRGGLVVEGSSDDVLAAAVHGVLTKRALRERLIAEGRRSVELFSPAQTARALSAALRSFFAESSRSI